MAAQPDHSPPCAPERHSWWRRVLGVLSLDFAPLVAISIAVTWMPLLVLCLIEGTAFGERVTITFLGDHTVHGRLLFAVPLLLRLFGVVERRTSLAIEHLRRADLVAGRSNEAFETAVVATLRARRSPTVRWTLAALAFAGAVPALAFARMELSVSSWMFAGNSGTATLSAAGIWNFVVAGSLMRLLFLRAFWELAIWAWLLARLSRLDLQLNPLHSDRRCGLRFLGETQLAFSPLVAALGLQFGCIAAVTIRYQEAVPASYQILAAAFVALCLILVFGPLLLFARQSLLAKEQTLYAFSAWDSLAGERIARLVLDAERERLPDHLRTPYISSMADAAALFDRLLATWPVPIDMRHIVTVALAAIVPLLLPLIALLPLADIAARLVKLLL